MGLKLLCVVAHPDDECFAFGGALALAADAGVETSVICMTDGQAATHRGDSADSTDLGRMRREEFAASCDVLGVHQHELLTFQDGQLEFADFSSAARLLVDRIRAFRPDVVLTFSMDGALNTHPDHTMVSALTTAAFHWAGLEKRFPELSPPHAAARLYTLSTSYFMEGRPAPAPAPWSVKLNIADVAARKQKAFEQHRSQAPLIEQTRAMFAEHGRFEYYTLAAAREPQAAAITDSLFHGL